MLTHIAPLPAQPTLRSLFPDAPADGDITIIRPPDTLVRARLWSRIAWALFIAALGALALSLQVLRSDLPIELLIVTLPLGAACVALGIPLYYVPRRRMRAPVLDDAPVSWEEWALARGFARVDSDSGGAAPYDGVLFPEVPHRSWPGLYRGRAGEVEVLAGSTRWSSSDDSPSSCNDVCFVVATLPAEVARQFPGCSLTRYLRSLPAPSMDFPNGRRLRFESALFDNCCNVIVDRTTPPERWWELFDPITIDGLLHTHDVQWHQSGRALYLLAPTRADHMQHSARLDSLCAAASWLVGRYVAAAR